MQIARDKTKAFFIIFPTKFGVIPDYNEIEREVMSRDMPTILTVDKIEKQLKNMQTKEFHSLG